MIKNDLLHPFKKYVTMAIIAGAISWVGMTSGCASSTTAIHPETANKITDPLQEQKNMPLQPSTGTQAQFAGLHIPADVAVASIEIMGVAENGQTITGAARPINAPEGEVKQAFWWDLNRQQWQWIKGEASDPRYNTYSTPIGTDSAGSLVLGSQWVWSSDTRKLTKLGSGFWAYALREDHMLLGVELGHRIVMRSIDGAKKSTWKAEQVFNIQSKELRGELSQNNLNSQNNQLWFAPNGDLVASTLGACLEDPNCHKAYFIRWSVESQQTLVPIQLPEREANEFMQSALGSPVISANGSWLLGSVGQKFYLWNEAGEIQFLGGFQNGGAVISISNDGGMAVGTTIDESTHQVRSWLWTQTEGLGWLDEWLVNHGVDKANTSKSMQVKALSADRRILLGLTPTQEGEGAAQPRWWQIHLPEKLRVLI